MWYINRSIQFVIDTVGDAEHLPNESISNSNGTSDHGTIGRSRVGREGVELPLAASQGQEGAVPGPDRRTPAGHDDGSRVGGGLRSLCRQTGNELVESKTEDDAFIFLIRNTAS